MDSPFLSPQDNCGTCIALFGSANPPMMTVAAILWAGCLPRTPSAGYVPLPDIVRKESPPVPACPICGDPDSQFLGTIVASVSVKLCQHTDTYYCTRCEYVWRVDHEPDPPRRQYSVDDDFEITEATIIDQF